MPKKFHAMTAVQRRVMLDAGFLPKEVHEFDYNTTFEFGDKWSQNMIRSRRKWVEAMRLNGWSNNEVASRIRRYYTLEKEHSPWDFFRLEYIHLLQKPTITKGRFAQFLQNRYDISRQFGRAYGRIQSVMRKHLTGMKGVPKRR